MVCMNSRNLASVPAGWVVDAPEITVGGGAPAAGLDTGARPKPAPISGARGFGLALGSSLFILREAGTIEVNAWEKYDEMA